MKVTTFILSVYFILFILSVAAQDDGNIMISYENQTPPFSMNLFSVMPMVGYSHLTVYGILSDGIWIFNLLYLHHLIPLAAALGVWTMGNIGGKRVSFMWPLIGSFAAYPLRYYIYDESVCFMAMVITSSLLFYFISKRWQTSAEEDPHTEVLGLRDSPQQEITSTWRRSSSEIDQSKDDTHSPPAAALDKFVEIQPGDELLSYSKSCPTRNNNEDNTPKNIWSPTMPIPIPSQKWYAQRAGQITPFTSRSSSQIFTMSTDKLDNITNVRALVNRCGSRSYIVNGNRSLLNHSNNHNINNRRYFNASSSDESIEPVSDSTTSYDYSSTVSSSDTKCIMPGFFNRSVRRLRQNTAIVGRFFKRNALKKEEINRFYGIQSHVQPICALATALSRDFTILDNQQNINGIHEVRAQSYSRAETFEHLRDDSYVTSGGVYQSTITMPQEQQATITMPQEQQATITMPQEQQATITMPQEQQATITMPQEQQAGNQFNRYRIHNRGGTVSI